MAIFRGGVKVGKFDVRTGLSKQRAQGILRQIGVLDKKDTAVKAAHGEIDVIRSIIGKGEGFQMPANFKVSFKCPQGVDQRTFTAGDPFMSEGYRGSNSSRVQDGGLDHRTHILNRSEKVGIKEMFLEARTTAQTTYRPFGIASGNRTESKLDLYCSKVTIPEKQITTNLYQHSSSPTFPFPTGVQYGTITTTFYCDATMTIKRFFDAWQKLIYNDITGNMNYYNEYTSEFDVFTRATIASTSGKLKESEFGGDESMADKISNTIKGATAKLDELTGMEGRSTDDQAKHAIPKVRFIENYGVKVFQCFPSIVSAIDLSHDATDQIATFDVTWSYMKWNPFKLGNLGIKDRGAINLAIGEFRNEKDGFPFIEDLPPELSGPLSGAVNQGFNTSAASNFSNLVG